MVNRRAARRTPGPTLNEKFRVASWFAVIAIAITVPSAVASADATEVTPVAGHDAPVATLTADDRPASTDGSPATVPDAGPATDTGTDTETEPDGEPDTAPTTVPDTARPPTTANDFFPEDRDITSCIGVLERPGCGSESRGGWRQTLVLLAIFAGLAVVFTNVVRGIRRNRGD